MSGPVTSRRAAVAAGAAGLAAVALAACGARDDDSPGDDATGPPGEDAGSGEVIARLADVPEGGGVSLDGPQVVLTRPQAREIRAFSSICTHEGCPVRSVSGGTVNCVCHGSSFAIEDGAVVTGPATRPLPPLESVVRGEDLLPG